MGGRVFTHARASCLEECSLKSYFWCPGSSHQLRASRYRGLRRSLSSKLPGCPPHPTLEPCKGAHTQAALGEGWPGWDPSVESSSPSRPPNPQPGRRPRPIEVNVENQGRSEKQAKDIAGLSPPHRPHHGCLEWKQGWGPLACHPAGGSSPGTGTPRKRDGEKGEDGSTYRLTHLWGPNSTFPAQGV